VRLVAEVSSNGRTASEGWAGGGEEVWCTGRSREAIVRRGDNKSRNVRAGIGVEGDARVEEERCRMVGCQPRSLSA
jgi:hypothetical protein